MLSVVAIVLSSSAAFVPAFAPLSRVGATSAEINMNAANNANVKFNKKSGNKGLYGWQVKKNSKTGDTANLRGYTVGSRAPPMAISSGTTIASSGMRYKGVQRRNVYSVPGAAGDSGLDLRDFGGEAKLIPFVHRQVMMTGGQEKDCFINRAKAGPIAATNPIFLHEGTMI